MLVRPLSTDMGRELVFCWLSVGPYTEWNLLLLLFVTVEPVVKGSPVVAVTDDPGSSAMTHASSSESGRGQGRPWSFLLLPISVTSQRFFVSNMKKKMGYQVGAT